MPMASPSPSSSSSRPSQPPRSPLFTAIAEMYKEEVEQQGGGDEEIKPAPSKPKAMPPEAPDDAFPYKHQPTPLHQPKKTTGTPTNSSSSSISVLCNKCRPSPPCDKAFVAPFDLKSPNSAPKAILNSLLHSLTRGKSPRPAPTAPSPAEDGQYWKLAAAELSRKLVHTTRKRDEALLEASRLKQSVSDLERKLTRLESDCLALRSSLDSHHRQQPALFPADAFLSAVSSARSAVRALARSKRTGSPLVQVEASINRLFYEGFEKPAEEEGRVLDPVGRCGLSRAAYEAVRGITWEDVLTKGTKHCSEGLSRFCDRKMGEVVGVLGWERAWPESLLQAFFAAAKGVWLVGLLARCVHPPVPVLRVEGGARFDPAYMEDVAPGERVRRLVPASVRMMVAPGFYVYTGGAGVLKCKVLCTYVQE